MLLPLDAFLHYLFTLNTKILKMPSGFLDLYMWLTCADQKHTPSSSCICEVRDSPGVVFFSEGAQPCRSGLQCFRCRV